MQATFLLMKFEDRKPVATAKQVYKQYSAKDMADYKAMKAGETKVKNEGAVAPMREVNHRVWEEDPESVNQKVVDKQKKDTKCTPYGMTTTRGSSSKAGTSIGCMPRADKA